MGDKTKIDWCDASWNPVTGCLHGCEYCYARRIAMRFCTNEHGKDEYGVAYPCGSIGNCTFCSELDGAEFVGDGIRWNNDPSAAYPFGFFPTFHPHKLDVPAHWKRPRTIFVCSMADLFGEWVPDEWIKVVFNACKEAPQHRYLFLTKNPDRYLDLDKKELLPREFWYGYTATRNDDLWRFIHADECPCIHLFVSIEPMQEPINPGFCSYVPADWVIMGAETGNRKNKAIPDKSWIMEIAEECEWMGIPVFMKESIREIMGEDFRQEFPWEDKKRNETK